MSEAPASYPIVPAFLLRGFADGEGRVMLEKRDRSRRQLAPLDEAARLGGHYAPLADRADPDRLARLLADVEAGAARAVGGILAGVFPPPAESRAALALFLALRLLMGRGRRAAQSEAATLLAELAASNVPEPEEPASDESGSGPATAAVELAVENGRPDRLSLASALSLARVLLRRTWQLVRFGQPVLLTGDAPVVAWSHPRATRSYPQGVAAAQEVRVPLDARHALIVARQASLGEVVRDLGDRHAAALNRIVAETAHAWVAYHPASDPLGGVELG
jgi:hypothetical protein